MKAIILAGGKGTRLAPYTTILPKPLMPVGDMPILEVVLRQLKRNGITDVTMAVGHLAELLMSYFGDGNRLGIDIRYSRESEPLGTAGPLRLIDGLQDTFLVMNGDVLTTLDFHALIRYHKQMGALATIAMHRRTVKIDLGVIEIDDHNQLMDYREKPALDYLVSMGIYVFEPQVLDLIPRGQRLDFPDLVKQLLRNHQRVVGYPFDGYWLDIGRPDDYQQAVEDFEKMQNVFLKSESDDH